ncbi:MAG: hypothetical protein KAS07_05960, partial [Candidatus Pacebacteria bacterium]|nr:hypothetical protein [Candidatus Paceibacterota bacterium]
MGIERPQARKITKAEDVLLKEKIRQQSKAVREAAPSIREKLRTKILNDITEKKTRVKLVKGSIMELSKTIPLEQRGKLLTTIKNANSFKDLERARAYIEKIGDVSTKKNLIRSIDNLLKKTKAKKQFGKPVGKYTPEVQRTLDLFRAASSMSRGDAEKIIESNVEKISDTVFIDSRKDKIEHADIEDLALQNRILTMGSGVTDMNIEALNSLYTVISEMEKTGALINALRKFNRQTETRQNKDSAIDTITGGKGIKEGTETVGVQERHADPKTWTESWHAAVNKIQAMGKVFVGWQDILDMMSSHDKKSKPFESWLNNFGETLDEENAYSDNLKEDTVDLRTMFANTYELESDRQIDSKMRKDTEKISLGVFENSKGNIVELKMSRAEARKRWMELQDPTLTEAFEEGMFYTDEIVEANDSFLTTKDKEFVQAQLDFYQDFYKKINKVYRDLFGVDLPYNPVYSPISRGDIDKKTGDIFSAFKGGIDFRNSISK